MKNKNKKKKEAEEEEEKFGERRMRKKGLMNDKEAEMDVEEE